MQTSLYFLFLCLAVVGCQKTKIKDVVDNPAKYDNAIVKVTGIVKNPVNFGYFRYFTLQDDTTEILVRLHEKANSPNEGSQIEVQGKVKEEYKIFGYKKIVIEQTLN